MITNHDALLKIRHQIQTAELYQANNPDFETSKEVLAVLRKREKILANQVQVEIFRTEIDKTKMIQATRSIS